MRRVVPVTLVLALALAHPAPVRADHAHEAPGSAAPSARRIDGLGTWHHAITTTSPEAQAYFDQGLRLCYAFNHEEAIRAFQQAATIDPTCAMAYWGIALAHGPNINLPMEKESEQKAYDALLKATELMKGATPAERDYITALTARYGAAAGADREARDQRYAAAMRRLAGRYPDDPDAATLCAEALMDQHPWDFWTTAGEAKPWTNEIVHRLEHVLAKWPDHPGANHYYIHAVEASRNPGRALASAGRLMNMMPAAGHLVHMPAHIFERTGRYEAAAEANRRAIAVDEDYIEKDHIQGVYAMMYYPHNIHFLTAALCMEGRSAEALRQARKVGPMVTPAMLAQMPMAEFVVPAPLFVLTRFGRWDEILREPRPSAGMLYTTGIWRYARGLAFAATNRLDRAEAERDSLAALADRLPPDLVVGFNPAVALLHVATNALAGEITARRGDYPRAVAHLEAAVASEDQLMYDEPPDWLNPVRPSLGAVLLEAGRARDAERVYREDLARNPGNGWSLYGLARSLRAEQRDREAAETEKAFAAAWAHADVKLTASRF